MPKCIKTIELPVVCPVCRAKLGIVLTEGSRDYKLQKHIKNQHSGYCICGDPIKRHKRCIACGIWIGRNHLEDIAHSRQEYDFCGSCVRQYDENPRKVKPYMIYPLKNYLYGK